MTALPEPVSLSGNRFNRSSKRFCGNPWSQQLLPACIKVICTTCRPLESVPSCILAVVLLASYAGFSAQANAACPANPDSTITDLPDFTCISADQAASLYAAPTSYRIMRKGKRIGKHSVQIDSIGSTGTTQLNVAVKSRIRITVLKIPVFSFDYNATEMWKNGLLEKVDAQTSENSDKTSVSAVRDGGKFILRNGAKQQTVNGLEYASNHWHPGVLGATSLFNTLTGKKNSVEIEMLGKSLLKLPAGNVEATHFRYTGNLQAEVWYDDSGRWVQLRFEGGDGSEIFYQLEQPAL